MILTRPHIICPRSWRSAVLCCHDRAPWKKGFIALVRLGTAGLLNNSGRFTNTCPVMTCAISRIIVWIQNWIQKLVRNRGYLQRGVADLARSGPPPPSRQSGKQLVSTLLAPPQAEPVADAITCASDQKSMLYIGRLFLMPFELG